MPTYESRAGTQMVERAYTSSKFLERLIDRWGLEPQRPCAAQGVTDN